MSDPVNIDRVLEGTEEEESTFHAIPMTIVLEEEDVGKDEAAGTPLLYPMIQRAREAWYDGPLLSLTRPATSITEKTTREGEQDTAFDPEELLIDLPEWSSLTSTLYARIQSPAGLVSRDASEQVAAEKALEQQISWAGHIAIPSLVIALPTLMEDIPAFARSISAILPTLVFSQLWIDVPWDTEGWRRWACMYNLCERSPKLLVAPRITPLAHAGETEGEVFVMERWRAEPIGAAIIPTSTFLPNAKEYPTLAKPIQTFLRALIPLFPTAVLVVSSEERVDRPELHLQYLRHLSSTLPPLDIVDTFASGYQDYLQAPLQPLMDNLDAGTYSVFEKDPVKYVQYENAIYQALVERHANATTPPVVMVVGAGGRGPLVDCALAASARADQPIRVYAVEKNPNALVTLRVKQRAEWGDRVEIVHQDMRRWVAPERADILVSELLGSFGDNELSPECLDGAQSFLKEEGISIPCSSTAHLALLSSSKLHADVSSYGERSKAETPYVVMFRRVFEATPSQEVWRFETPLRATADGTIGGVREDNTHNSRYSELTFRPEGDMRLDGLAGYFDSCLYEDIYISTNPGTFSEGMFSWFPLYFPLQTPLLVPGDSQVRTRMWRRTHGGHVWYEWAAEVIGEGGTTLSRSPIHNLCGRSYKIGM